MRLTVRRPHLHGSRPIVPTSLVVAAPATVASPAGGNGGASPLVVCAHRRVPRCHGAQRLVGAGGPSARATRLLAPSKQGCPPSIAHPGSRDQCGGGGRYAGSGKRSRTMCTRRCQATSLSCKGYPSSAQRACPPLQAGQVPPPHGSQPRQRLILGHTRELTGRAPATHHRPALRPC